MKNLLEKMGQNISAFTNIFDSIIDLIFFMEIAGDSFRYTYANKSALRVMNHSENILGRRIEDIVSAEHARVLIPKYKQVQSTLEPVSFSETLKTVDGEFIGESTLSPILTEDGQCKSILAIVRDITERKQKESELKETKRTLEQHQKRLNSLIENNGDAVFELDLQGRFVGINQMVTELTGYREEDLISQSFIPLIVEEHLAETSTYFERALNSSKEEYETLIYKKDGQRILLYVKNVPIIVDDTTVGVYGIAKDITEENKLKQDLIKKNEELEIFWEYTVDPISFLNTKGEIVKVNPAFEKTFGYRKEEIMGTKYRIVPQENIGKADALLTKVFSGEVVSAYETKRRTKDGRILDILVSYTPVRDDKGKIIGATSFNKDVTTMKKAEKKLRESEENYRLITENAFDVIKLINPSGIVEYVSPSNEKILGYTSSEYVGKHYATYIHPDDIAKLEKGFNCLLKERQSSTTELRLQHKDGNWIWLEATTTPIIEDGEVKQLVTIARDSTERKKLQEQLANMAFYDYLTGLANRRTFENRLEIAIHQADCSNNKVAMMMLDGRKFKQVNDTYGHDAGDAVLKEMAKRLQTCVRKTDTVARLGGDEMGIILPDIDEIKLVKDMAKRIIQSFAKPLFFNGHHISLGAGIGIAFYPDHATDKKQLMKYADKALYEAKEANQTVYRIYK